ncbi:hypothetical protein ACFBZI_11650 [Moraxella sp. ZJ142]
MGLLNNKKWLALKECKPLQPTDKGDCQQRYYREFLAAEQDHHG